MKRKSAKQFLEIRKIQFWTCDMNQDPDMRIFSLFNTLVVHTQTLMYPVKLEYNENWLTWWDNQKPSTTSDHIEAYRQSLALTRKVVCTSTEIIAQMPRQIIFSNN